MKVLLFGATGMIGQGVLRECLRAADVERVVVVGRRPLGQTHAKLRELVRGDLDDLDGLDDELRGHDACFFCVGVSSAGMNEADYQRVTYDLTLGVARRLAALSPQLTFVYVSGAGADASERGRIMWARVKGRTENALLTLPFARAFMFRPGFIQPRHGIRSRTALYRVFYALLAPLYPLLRLMAGRFVTNTEDLGRAMLEVARHGAERRVLESDAINAAAARSLRPE